MSAAILASLLKIKYPTVHFVIDDKKAVDKTFPAFWKYLSEAGVELLPPTASPNPLVEVYQPAKSIIIVGDRGAGKTSIGKFIAHKLGLAFIDLDELITNALKD